MNIFFYLFIFLEWYFSTKTAARQQFDSL